MSIDSPKSKGVEAKLPEELRSVYREIVQDYEFLTHVRYGRGYVAYEVLAQMVLAGWRPGAEAHPSSDLARRDAGDGRAAGGEG